MQHCSVEQAHRSSSTNALRWICLHQTMRKKKMLGTPSCACGAPSSARRDRYLHHTAVAIEHLNAQGRPSGSIVGVTGHCYWHKLAIKVRQRSTSQQPSRSLSRSLFQTPSVENNIVSIDKHSKRRLVPTATLPTTHYFGVLVWEKIFNADSLTRAYELV